MTAVYTDAVSEVSQHPMPLPTGIIVPESSNPRKAVLIALARQRWAMLQERRRELADCGSEGVVIQGLLVKGLSAIRRAEFSIYRDGMALGVDVRVEAGQ